MTKSTNRCSCLATSTNRKCKLSYKFQIQNKKFCFIHASILFSKSVIIIQKYFVGWRLRKKMNNLFNPLPEDLQRKIIWYIREPYYIKQYHHKPIQKILDKRFKILSNNRCFTQYSFPSATAVIRYYTELMGLYKLYTKYISIARQECSTCLYVGAARNIKHFRWAIQNDNFGAVDQVIIYKMKDLLEASTNKFWTAYQELYHNKPIIVN